MSPEMEPRGPSILSLLTTYQCTAECAECCFGCGPRVAGRMSTDDMIRHINTFHRAFPSLRAVVFTGGECFLLGRSLWEAVTYARANGLGVRCVTNGYWGTSRMAAEKHLRPLLDAGLNEINFSTGVEHQRFVPYDRVANAAVASAELGLTTLVSVEATPGASFALEHARQHPVVAEHLRRAPHSRLLFISSVWTDLETPSTDGELGSRTTPPRRKGCESLFDSIAVEPGGHVLGCCGLTSTRIRELVLGRDLDEVDLRRAYDQQLTDLVKLWISLDGPAHVGRALRAGLDPGWRAATHQCVACLELFTRPHFAEALRRGGAEHAADVVFRYTVRERLRSGRQAGGA